MIERVPVGYVLTSAAIQSIDIEIDRVYLDVCRKFLESQGCSLLPAQSVGWYTVGFPAGTVVQDRLGTSGLYTRRRYVVLPNKTELSVYSTTPPNPYQKARVTMGFPVDIFPK